MARPSPLPRAVDAFARVHIEASVAAKLIALASAAVVGYSLGATPRSVVDATIPAQTGPTAVEARRAADIVHGSAVASDGARIRTSSQAHVARLFKGSRRTGRADICRRLTVRRLLGVATPRAHEQRLALRELVVAAAARRRASRAGATDARHRVRQTRARRRRGRAPDSRAARELRLHASDSADAARSDAARRTRLRVAMSRLTTAAQAGSGRDSHQKPPFLPAGHATT